MDYSTINEQNQSLPSPELPIFSTIPASLRAYPQWVNWSYRQVDIDTITRVYTDELQSAEEAYAKAIDGDLGIGFVLSSDDPFVAIDLYDCYDQESRLMLPWAMDIAQSIDSYGELLDDNSLRIFASAGATDNRRRGSIAIQSIGPVAVTGNRIGQVTDVRHRQLEVEQFIDEHLTKTFFEYANEAKAQGLEGKAFCEFALKKCLGAEGWHKQPDLMPFLALCWEYPELRLMVQSKIAEDRWTKDRREDFIKCIQDAMPPKPQAEKEEKDHKIIRAGHWESQLQWDARGSKVKENFYNCAVILQNHEAFAGRIRYDQFLSTPIIDDRPVTDAMEDDIAMWLGDEYEFGGNHPKSLGRAIKQVAMKSSFDSLREWLLSLPKWDGQDRLHNWLINWCGAEDKPSTPWIGYVTIMQMVARALTPGCMARLVTVFEGDEDQGKTRAIKILGDPWAITFDMSMDSKEAHMAMQGVWLAELAELDTLRKTTETRLKSFISQQQDSYIPKYENHMVSHLRRTVFIGTTNEDAYLLSTGNTRFLPVKTGWFDLETLEKNRGQLIAEARDLLLATPDIRWWEMPGDIKGPIREERDSRRLVNVYEAELEGWLNGDIGGVAPKYKEYGSPPVSTKKYREVVTWQEVAKDFLGIETPERWKDKALQMQIAQALKSLGWSHTRQAIDGVRTRCWVRGSEDSSEVPF